MSSSSDTSSTNTDDDLPYVFFTGICMGAADVVPGVSGGTMAFIMGVYERLLDAIKSFNLELLKKLLRFDLRGCFEQVPWKFILALVGGIGVSVLSLVHLVTHLMEHHQAHLFAFFFGLVVASILLLGRQLQWRATALMAGLAGAVAAWLFVTLSPQEMPAQPLYLFFAGMIAIMAMILPGISGSFLLLILGHYLTITTAVKNLKDPSEWGHSVQILLPVALGAAIGLMGFSRVLSWCLNRYHTVMVALLTGFMVGSLRKIYPFKEAVTSMTKEDGEVVVLVDRMVLPDFSSTDFWISVVLAGVGMASILVIDRIHQSRLQAHSQLPS